MKEQWKPFRHGCYEISNLGRVRRAKPGRGTFVGKMLKLVVTGSGYIKVGASYNCRLKVYFIAPLVARKFIGPCPEGKEVNHKDCNKLNCRWDNLEYLTHRDNLHHSAKLNYEKVRKIKQLYFRKGYSQLQLSKRFGVTQAHISYVINDKTWKKVA